ncbi:MAG TPA: hypothetical protein VFH06_01300 [Candidatus Saccharimonadales bacterium]|nr:hypothetical protein [Candidatus Saccharimonadales bacterium]
MNSSRAIGGYFDLETRMGGSTYHDGLIELNSARNAFEYILRVKKPRRVYMPKFTCDVMLEPFQKTNTEYVHYALNDQLEIADTIKPMVDELVLYTNYFGIKDTYTQKLSKQFGEQLIVDCSQAFYYVSAGKEDVFYSPRKFVGVADGAYLKTEEILNKKLEFDTSYQRMEHLLKRVDMGAEAGYESFKKNDESLVGEPIKHMSHLTKKILDSLNYEKIREARLRNFGLLHAMLGDKNELTIDHTQNFVPMVYPFKPSDSTGLRQRLIEQKVFVPTYWPNVFEWCNEGEVEYQLARDIIPLPIDQRYSKKDMQRITEILI